MYVNKMSSSGVILWFEIVFVWKLRYKVFCFVCTRRKHIHSGNGSLNKRLPVALYVASLISIYLMLYFVVVG